MHYRRLGRTNLNVSVIGIGTTQLRRVPERQAVETLKRAFELGVNLVNAEPDYEGAYDLILAALREYDHPEQIYLSIQAGDHPAAFERIFEATCETFDRECIALYGITSISDQEAFGCNVWGSGGLVEFLQRKKEEGRIRAIFASDHGSPEQTKALIERDVFDALMLAYNPIGFHLITYRAETVWDFETPPLPIVDYKREDLPRTRQELIPMAKARDVGIMLMKPLAGGLLCSGKAFPNHPWRDGLPQPPSAKNVLRYLLMDEAIDCVVPGMASIEEVEENVEAGTGTIRLNAEETAQVEARVAALSHVLCSRCGQCDDLCSRGLPISYLFRAAYHYLYPNAPYGISSTLQYFRLHPWEECRCETCEAPTCRCHAGIDIPGELRTIHRKMLALRDQGLAPAVDPDEEIWATGKPYSVKVFSREIPTTLEADEQATVRLHLRNTGTQPWYRQTDKDHARVALAVFLNDHRIQQIRLRQDVFPKTDCHFAFTFEAPAEPGIHALRLELFDEETGLFSKAGVPPICETIRTTTKAPLSARYLEHDVPAECVAGTRCVFRMLVENTGTEPWYRQPADGHSAGLGFFLNGKTVGVGNPVRDVVKPGERAEIAVTASLPEQPGPYRFRFDMMISNRTWFSEVGVPPFEGCLQLTDGAKSRTDVLLDMAYRRNTWYFSPSQSIHRSYGQPRYPVFAESAKGCYITDVEGKQFLDLHMGWGCCLLGYAEARIQAAIARAVAASAGIISLPHRLEIEAAEALCDGFPWGNEAIFGKNGSDLTTWAIRTARIATGRKTIVFAGYHGWQDWNIGNLGFEATGVPSDNNRYAVSLPYCDAQALDKAVAHHADDLAAILIEPAHKCVDIADPHHTADGPYLKQAQALARKHGALFILDEIMTGFRFRSGSAQAAYGLTPDLTCLGKAIANGMPLSALVTRDDLLKRNIARIVYAPTMKGEVYSFAATLEALRIYQEEDIPAIVWAIGERIRDGVNAICKDLGLKAMLIGPPYRMYLRFFGLTYENDVFCRTVLQQELARHGVINHRGYVILSRRHDQEAVTQGLSAFDAALRTIREAMASSSRIGYLDIPDVIGGDRMTEEEEAEKEEVRHFGQAPHPAKNGAIDTNGVDESPDEKPGTRDARALLLKEIRGGRARLQSRPATVNIELTGRCNFTPPCTYCVGKNKPGYKEPGHITPEKLDLYWPYFLTSQRVNDCSYGEPLLYPGLKDLIERLAAEGITFGFTTNGLLLNERRARFLIEHADTLEFIVSLNAATPETYFRHHGQNFELILKNLEQFARLHRERRPARQSPLILSYIVMRSNQHEVFDFLRIAAGLDVKKAVLRHLFDLGEENYAIENFGHSFVYEDERLPYDDYKQIEARIRAEPDFAGLTIDYEWNAEESFIAEQAEEGVDIPCLFPWKFLCIRTHHDIYTPCAFMKKSIAAPSHMSMDEIWNGDVMVSLRKELAAGEIPGFCMAFGDCCPLVLEQREKDSNGIYAGRNGNNEAALVEQDFIELQPDNPHFYRRMGTVLLKQGNFEGARGHFQKAIALDPRQFWAHYNLGKALDQLGHLDEAISAYQEAITLQTSDPEVYCSLGNILLWKKGDAESALVHYRKALTLNASHFGAYNNLGEALSRLDKLDEAFAAFEKARSIEPDNPHVYRRLGVYHRKKGYFEEAITNFQKALALEPDNPDVLCSLGDCHVYQGRPAQASAFFQKATEVAPSFFWAFRNLGDALCRQKKPEAAFAAYQKAMALEPDNPHLHCSLGHFHLLQGNLEDAVAHCRKAIALKLQDAWTYEILGDALDQLGQKGQALEAYQKALQIQPDNPALRQKLNERTRHAFKWFKQFRAS